MCLTLVYGTHSRSGTRTCAAPPECLRSPVEPEDPRRGSPRSRRGPSGITRAGQDPVDVMQRTFDDAEVSRIRHCIARACDAKHLADRMWPAAAVVSDGRRLSPRTSGLHRRCVLAARHRRRTTRCLHCELFQRAPPSSRCSTRASGGPLATTAHRDGTPHPPGGHRA